MPLQRCLGEGLAVAQASLLRAAPPCLRSLPHPRAMRLMGRGCGPILPPAGSSVTERDGWMMNGLPHPH